MSAKTTAEPLTGTKPADKQTALPLLGGPTTTKLKAPEGYRVTGGGTFWYWYTTGQGGKAFRSSRNPDRFYTEIACIQDAWRDHDGLPKPANADGKNDVVDNVTRLPLTKKEQKRREKALAAAAAARKPYVAPIDAPKVAMVPPKRPKTKANLAMLMDILSYMRPAFSQAEEDFITKFIMPFGPTRDQYGNLWLKVGENPDILWSSHTDTVHHDDGRQEVLLDKNGFLTAKVQDENKKKLSNCLGADDGVGIWMMIEMINAGVEGLYIFHREEERGGKGSSFIKNTFKNLQLLKDIRFAIALDRKAYHSVITSQHGSRCCSDAFAKSLAAILGGDFVPDSTGVFTDTANYVDIIGECTNLSVGYFSQHGPMEKQDMNFAVSLRDMLVTADFSQLVSERKPGEREVSRWDSYGSRGYTPPKPYTPPSTTGGGTTPKDTSYYDQAEKVWKDKPLSQTPPTPSKSIKPEDATDKELGYIDRLLDPSTDEEGGAMPPFDPEAPGVQQLEDFIWSHTEEVAHWLSTQGITVKDLAGDLGYTL